MSGLAYISAPHLVQGEDEKVLLRLGDVIFPEFIARNDSGPGLRIRVDGDYRAPTVYRYAAAQFQILLGILRAWQPVAGQRADELRPSLGSGPIKNENGDLLITVPTINAYSPLGSKVEQFARQASSALECSPALRNALWLFGRRDRNSADFYMVYEYAKREFGNDRRISKCLSVAEKDIQSLKQSANNLAPIEGGRHANENQSPKWDLDRQLWFTSTLLNQWIACKSLVLD